MTVRAWFTISALVLAALAAAFAFRLFAPVPAPEIRVRAGDVVLEGTLVEACWPQRGAELRCERRRSEDIPTSRIPPEGTLRFSASYPAAPGEGSILIASVDTGRRVVREEWMRSLRYELVPGDYELTAEARYPGRAFVRYAFRFTVTRSGS